MQKVICFILLGLEENRSVKSRCSQGSTHGKEHSLALPLQPERLANRGVDYLHREANVKKGKQY